MGIIKKYELGRVEVLFIIVVLLAAVLAGVYVWKTSRDKESAINSFADCVAAGNPVMESYPEQCAANGQTFVNSTQAQVSRPNNVQDGITTFVDDTVFHEQLRAEIMSNVVEPFIDFNEVTDVDKIRISKSDDSVYPYMLVYDVDGSRVGEFLFGETDGSAGYWYPENCDPFNDSTCSEALDEFNQKYPQNYQDHKSNSGM